MKTITLNDQQVNIYTINDFPYNMLKNIETIGKGKRKYSNCIATFDIETTSMSVKDCNILGHDFGFMYVWQFCIEGICVIGRTWEEYFSFLEMLKHILKLDGRTLVIWVHNLSFEFQFIRNFLHVDKIFATEKREVLYFKSECFEYRCSYRLTNMGLEKFTQKTPGVTFPKLDGEDFDYRIYRYPDTELTDKELGYCVSDVLGLYQAMKYKLTEDTLLTIPLTSTGYVRRDYQEVCLKTKGYRSRMLKKELNSNMYILCREASRGAISGSNHIYTNETLYNVDSFDIKSSYPYVMATEYFPVTKFLKFNYNKTSLDNKLLTLLNTMCCIVVWSCKNLKLKRWRAIPYISKAKCRAIENGKCGNGKVYMADKIGMCCTEIDMLIILNDYYCTDVKIHELYVAERGMLEHPFRKHLLDMFQTKTDLEDGDPYDYIKYKNKINASFGMMLTDILHPEIIYNNDSKNAWEIEEIENMDYALKKYYTNKKSFLSYQDGIWVLAHARKNLHEGMEIVKHDIVQVDTDSVKTLGNYKEEFAKLNETIINKAETYDIKPYAINKKGEKVYLGIWEHEGEDNEYTYKIFRSLGAKKYINNDKKGHLVPTVAGLSKKSGSYFEEKGGIDFFKNGSVLPARDKKGRRVSGRTASLYNDEDRVYTINVLGHTVSVGSNIFISEVDYTLGMTGEWLMMTLSGDIDIDSDIGLDGAYKGWC